MKNTNAKSQSSNLPLILIILDGWGLAKPNLGNAITLAKTPTMSGLVKKYANTKLHAHGKFVGLPLKQVGNSEAGHMNIGAGRLVEQDAVLISRSISDGTFFKNSAFLGAVRHVHKMNSKFHIIGMLSNGQSPHSDPGHLIALLRLLKERGVKNIYLHLITDGRDSPKYVSLSLVDELEKKLVNNERIATIMGRFYAMDRKKSWDRTEKAFRALAYGQGREANTAQEAITEAYNRGESDEYIEPYIVGNSYGGNTRIEDGDSVAFINLRSDRSRQLTKAFVQDDFNKMNPGSFKRGKKLKHLYFVAMTDFGPDLNEILTAYPSIDLHNTIPMQLADLKQLYIAPLKKYAHITYFFNGGYAGTVAGEKHIMIPSPDVRSYDETPAMSSALLAKEVIRHLKPGSGKNWTYDFCLLNFAAPDMIGHTGNLKAGIDCCGEVDRLLAKIVKAYLSVNGTVIITADHGNIENMVNLKTGEIHTEHTTNQVPFVLVNKKIGNKIKLRQNGTLGDIGPTILELLGRKKPSEMSGKSLI